MPATRTHATLRIWPRRPGLGTATAVTGVLGISSTEAHELGEAKGDRESRTWANASWSLQSNLPWQQPLNEHVQQLCDAVEPHREALLGLAEEGSRLDFFCFVEVSTGNEGLAFTPETLRRVAELRMVGFDLTFTPAVMMRTSARRSEYEAECRQSSSTASRSTDAVLTTRFPHTSSTPP